MRIWIRNAGNSKASPKETPYQLAAQLSELGFCASVDTGNSALQSEDAVYLELIHGGSGDAGPDRTRLISVDGPESLLERTLRALPMDFDSLPLLVEGESKVIRLWTDHVVVERFKPTVYSYTFNRYGEAPGTSDTRVRFTAALFREMALLEPGDFPATTAPRSAFLAELETPGGPLLVQRRIDPCNLEVRIKRYHVGSPVHRYRYTEKYPSTQTYGPLQRWSRLDEPVVCFDWRHPLHDDLGNRLADEPISDDYAGVWMYNVDAAKQMARQTFLWLENRFEAAGIRLVDMCIFIDRWGKMIYGEISPDCMRVRLGLGDPAQEEASAKDVWRLGGSPEQLQQHYEYLYRCLFGDKKERS